MRVLLDTQAALYLWMAPDRLGHSARIVLEDPTNVLLFSQVSTWEICLKFQIGKLPLLSSPEKYLRKRIQESDLTYEPISDRALFDTVSLPHYHGDPFDRLLLATAQSLKVPIVSGDRNFPRYPVDVIW